MYSRIFATISAIVTLPLLVAPARAAEVEVARIPVHFADLNLSSSAGTKELYLRLSGAAKTACRDDSGVRDIAELHAIYRCQQIAIEKAVAQVDRPLLTALYDRRFPREPLTPASRASLVSQATTPAIVAR